MATWFVRNRALKSTTMFALNQVPTLRALTDRPHAAIRRAAALASLAQQLSSCSPRSPGSCPITDRPTGPISTVTTVSIHPRRSGNGVWRHKRNLLQDPGII